jgi:hypothetical protein
MIPARPSLVFGLFFLFFGCLKWISTAAFGLYGIGLLAMPKVCAAPI